MKKKILMSISMLLAMCFAFVSCSEDKNDVPETKTSVVINLETPINIGENTLTDGMVLLINKWGATYTYTIKEFEKTEKGYKAVVKDIPVGTYGVIAQGKLKYQSGGKEITTDVKATNDNVQLVEDMNKNSISLLLHVFTGKEGFVISEVFFRGTKTPQGKQYIADQYIKIANNTNEILYADGLVIMQSVFINGNKHNYLKDYRNEGFAADAVYMIPGDGDDVPVKPGASLLLALNAKNHKTVNPNSFDLSKADFEFYDVSTNNYKDEQNPGVRDLERIFCSSASILVLNMQGNKAYAIGKIQGTKKAFLKHNYYEAQYHNEINGKLITQKAYFLPSSWIIDAVNIDMQDNPHDWNILPISMDKGYTYCIANTKDATGVGKAVVRKMQNGKYVDTNNSTEDFTPKATPTVK